MFAILLDELCVAEWNLQWSVDGIALLRLHMM